MEEKMISHTGPEDEWVAVGNCWGPIFLRRSELKEFQRGSLAFIAWAVGVSAVFLMLFG